MRDGLKSHGTWKIMKLMSFCVNRLCFISHTYNTNAWYLFHGIYYYFYFDMEKWNMFITFYTFACVLFFKIELLSCTGPRDIIFCKPLKRLSKLQNYTQASRYYNLYSSLFFCHDIKLQTVCIETNINKS